jgi:hypothetical protein
MPEPIVVSSLVLDLKNPRTVPQSNEINALHTMISISPERFWALTRSLLQAGYLPTENIIVLKNSEESLVVKEGNRRVAALKLILGHLAAKGLAIPKDIQDQITAISQDWKRRNSAIPCTVYEMAQEDEVDAIVTLIHGKGDKASRDEWNSVATARHNRDKNGANEFGLDLLEEYLKSGRNVTDEQKETWSGEFPLTVLNEAIGMIARRLALAARRELVDLYKAGTHVAELNRVLRDIGDRKIGFEQVRMENSPVYDFPSAYGFPAPPKVSPPPINPLVPIPPPISSPLRPPLPPTRKRGRTKAVPIDDARSVYRKLRSFEPRGKGREKLVTLVEEARRLRLDKHPHCFCFLLRSMFEISAKVFVKDNPKAGIPLVKNSNDRPLVDVLRDVTDFLTDKGNKQNPLTKPLHGAMTELANKHTFVSITSLNQLVHNPQFVVTEKDLCAVFARVFPLLEEMNR